MASTIPLKGASINLWGWVWHIIPSFFFGHFGSSTPISIPQIHPWKVHLYHHTPLINLSPHLINKDLYDIHSTSPTPKSHTTCGCKEVFELHNFLSVKWRIWRQNYDLEHPGGVSFQKWDDLKNYTSIDPRSMECLSSIFRKLNLFRTDSKYTYSYIDILGKKQT